MRLLRFGPDLCGVVFDLVDRRDIRLGVKLERTPPLRSFLHRSPRSIEPGLPAAFAGLVTGPRFYGWFYGWFGGSGVPPVRALLCPPRGRRLPPAGGTRVPPVPRVTHTCGQLEVGLHREDRVPVWTSVGRRVDLPAPVPLHLDQPAFLEPPQRVPSSSLAEVGLTRDPSDPGPRVEPFCVRVVRDRQEHKPLTGGRRSIMVEHPCHRLHAHRVEHPRALCFATSGPPRKVRPKPPSR